MEILPDVPPSTSLYLIQIKPMPLIPLWMDVPFLVWRSIKDTQVFIDSLLYLSSPEKNYLFTFSYNKNHIPTLLQQLRYWIIQYEYKIVRIYRATERAG